MKSVDLMSLWNANYASRKRKVFSLIIPSSIHEGAVLEARRGPSTFKNMPVNVQEGRLLDARRACS